MYKLSTSLLAFLFICTTIAAQAQSQEYATLFYNQEHLELDTLERTDRKIMERHVYKMRKHRLTERERTLALKFHNFTSLSEEDFTNKVGIQVASLNRDFSVDTFTYNQLFKEKVNENGIYPVFLFEAVETSYESQKSDWIDWKVYQNPKESKNDIHIKIVEDLEERIGFGICTISMDESTRNFRNRY